MGCGNNRIKLARMNPELVSKEIGDFVIETVWKLKTSGCVIGLSGGVDSTTTAALAKRGLDRQNLHCSDSKPLELVGYMLPSKTNSPEDVADGIKVAERLGIRYEIINIEPVVDAYLSTNPEAFVTKYDKGNLMSRIRANILSTKAATENKTLLGTGNRDEDFGVGYYTLFGDGAVHCSPIGNLPKRLVREMARYLGFADLADRIPTAGLEPGQTDFGDLGYRYETVELVSEGLLQKFYPEELINHPQVAEYAIADMKQYQEQFGREKFSTVDQLVGDVLRRNKIAEGKAQIIHPPTANITLEYL